MKPRIKILSNGEVEHESRLPNSWLKGNLFRISVFRCWVDFLKNNRSK